MLKTDISIFSPEKGIAFHFALELRKVLVQTAIRPMYYSYF